MYYDLEEILQTHTCTFMYRKIFKEFKMRIVSFLLTYFDERYLNLYLYADLIKIIKRLHVCLYIFTMIAIDILIMIELFRCVTFLCRL